MARHQTAFAVFAVLATGVLGAGCSAAPNDAVATTDESLDALLGPSCDVASARRFDVALEGDESCESVAGRDGLWIARPIFGDAPESIRARTCRFTWRSDAHRGAGPDADALRDRFHGVLAPTCAKGRPPVLELSDPDESPPNVVQGGSIGCDVCGVVDNRRGWIVIPPGGDGRIVHVTVPVFDDHGTRILRFAAPAPPRATALEVHLPPPPPGAQYGGGRITISP